MNVPALLTSLFSPPYCEECGAFLQERTPLCKTCLEGLDLLVPCTVQVTPKYAMSVYALAAYSGVMRSLVMAKHRRCCAASIQLAQLVAEHLRCPWYQFDVMVPVALHWSRYAYRGFNQAQIIADALGKQFDIQVCSGVKRVRRTAFQASLSKEKRQSNVENTFFIPDDVGKTLRDKHVVIVDDVMTTGSTLQAVARSIVDCKPASISAVVAARVP